ALPGEQRLGDAAGPVVVGELRQVGGLDRVAPLARQVVERDPERAFEAALDAARDRRLEDLADRLFAPLLADVRQQRMAEPVREDPRSYVISSTVGRWPSRDASRSHMDVSGSIGPIERYSAIPSMNQP